MNLRNTRLIIMRELRDQLRDRRTLFMITILPVLLYPMLGLGIVEMMLTFSEQRRTVVILNADGLPDKPEFLNDQGILETLYQDGKSDADRLRVVTDRASEETEVPAVLVPGELPASELLNAARDLQTGLRELQAWKDPATLNAAQQRLTDQFSASGIQVLMIVPEGYSESLASMQKQITERAAITADQSPRQI
ncbi:MAG: CPBP family intramembrane glutamate endopeptidase, partial [Planctomyces sp.]